MTSRRPTTRRSGAQAPVGRPTIRRPTTGRSAMRRSGDRPHREADAPSDETGILAAHLDSLGPVLAALRPEASRLVSWGRELRRRLDGGGRLLAAGNGGSAAQAQHLTAELVGRFERDRAAYSAIALHAETSSLTAIGNDYGYDEVFARQVAAHGRVGDILILLSTSGRSRNLLLAAQAARRRGVTTWALTGAAPNPLADGCDDRICLPGPAANVQEGHLVALHTLCRVFDHALAAESNPTRIDPATETNQITESPATETV